MAAREQTKERILDAAYRLFYRLGYRRVGVEAVAEAANVTKRTLYNHFRSKDDLLAAVMRRQSALALARLEGWSSSKAVSLKDFISRLFDELVRWSSVPRWEGSGITRLVIELSDLPGHPARHLARRHKTAVEQFFRQRLARDAERGARQLQALMEGAMVLTLIHAERSYLEDAKAAALRLFCEKED